LAWKANRLELIDTERLDLIALTGLGEKGAEALVWVGGFALFSQEAIRLW